VTRRAGAASALPLDSTRATPRSLADPIGSIIRNSVILMAARVVSAAMGLALLALLPRLLGDTGYGQLHLALSLVLMFGVTIDLGIGQVLVRAVAREHALARVYTRRGVTVTLALGAVLYVCSLGLVRVVGYPARTDLLVAILGIGMLLDGMAQILSSLYQAHERMHVPALARIIGHLVTFGLLLPRLWQATPTDTATVAGVLVTGSLVQLLIQAAGLRWLDGLHTARPADLSWRALLAAGAPFVLWQSLGVFYFRIDVVMLGRMTPPAVLGWYGAVARMMDGLTFMAETLALTSYPVLARLWSSSRREFEQTTQRVLAIVLLIAVPLVTALVTLAPYIVDILFTSAFQNSVPILRIHAFTLGLLYLNFLLARILMAIGRERAWLGIAVMGCVLNPALNWAAIGFTQARYGNGGIGAALATLVMEMCIAACALRLVPHGALGWASAGVMLRLLMAGAATAAAIRLGLAVHAPWVLAGVAGAVVYLVLVLYFGLVPEDVRSRVRTMWRSAVEAVS
jgi:O-antigen/teichoic acid export membrane protein